MQMLKKVCFLCMVFVGLATGMAICSQAYAQTNVENGKVFIFDPRNFSWTAYENGEVVGSGSASGGSHYCQDIKRSCRTPVGVFSVQSKGGSDCKSSIYPKPNGGASMAYCMFFLNNYAIHASNSVPKYNASHGCVRVKPAAAYWLSKNFINIGTKVIVKPY